MSGVTYLPGGPIIRVDDKVDAGRAHEDFPQSDALELRRRALKGTGMFVSGVAAAKAWAKINGFRGDQGGFIRGASGKHVCQGWSAFAQILVGRGKIVAEFVGSLDHTTEFNGRIVSAMYGWKVVA